jgi:hypothetical protein
MTSGIRNSIGEVRPVGFVERGWHIRVHGQWYLVEVRSCSLGIQTVFLQGIVNPVQYIAAGEAMTRTPAEQLAATLVEEQHRKRALLKEVKAIRRARALAVAPCK